MKKALFILLLLVSLQSTAQSVFGYWYGNANVKSTGSANNYLIELILLPEKNYVKGVMNYYFKDVYKSIQVKGDYDAVNRRVTLYNIALPYHGSMGSFEVDCIMNFQGLLRVSQAGDFLTGNFIAMPDYKYTCANIGFNLQKNSDISKTDSVLKALSEFKETYQVWKPDINDTIVAVTVTPRKVVNYVVEKEFDERENVTVKEVEVESDTLRVDVYDNGEIDGDIISVFYNKQLILFNQKLTHKSIHIDLTLDPAKEYNELSMFAENLGLIPPNTALMVISDGKNKYNVPVSSNLQKNASIRIKRKKEK